MSGTVDLPLPRLTVGVWALWVREYGAHGAIRLALQQGFTQKEIRDANDEALRLAGA